MFCTKCGTQLPDDAAFCTSCGTSISPQPAQPSPAPTPNGAATAGGSKSAALIIVAVAVVAIAAAVAALVLSGMLGGGQTPEPQVPSSQPSAGGTGDASAPDATSLELAISQIDNEKFPTVTLYASILEDGTEPTASMTPELFTLTELDAKGAEHAGTIDELAPLAVGDAMNINLVLDQSGSMDESGKMGNAKSAADTFIDEITATEGNVAEITGFDDYVYNIQPFTSDKALLKSAVSSLRPDGGTALFDALYWALQRTNLKSGSRVVIAFTDGEENASYYDLADVVELSRMSGIPVYIIGIGDSIDRTSLRSLAEQCNGSYFDASESNLTQALAGIYDEIYSDQRAMYRIVYTSSYTGDESEYRTVSISCADGSGFEGEAESSYMPVDTVSSFDTSVNAQDYVLPDSSIRYYSRAELEKLSLWELYLARNEIFARYGRGFKNQDLVEYFATKRWYRQTATPEEFDANPTPLNDYEQKNTVAMLEIEKERNSPYITQNRT